MIPPPRPRLIILDLDGTLVDSLRDIAESVNECLVLLGMPTHPVDKYRFMVGEGVPMLCQRAIGDSHPHLVARLAELTRAAYRTRPLRHTVAYAGVPDLVAALRARRFPLAVLSNKPHELTRLIVESLWPADTFVAVQGYVDEQRRKPDPALALQIAASQSVAPTDMLLVGDTPTDVETARRAGATCIAVTWGFRSRDDLASAGARWIIDRPEELLMLLQA
jgi:phosphoglycolate phosphatase